MQIALYNESDGVCFAYTRHGECRILRSKDPHCNTFKCPFYKPKDGENHVKLERANTVILRNPDEVEYVRLR